MTAPVPGEAVSIPARAGIPGADGEKEMVYSGCASVPALNAGSLPHIFLDCDGVLADFDTYAEAYFGMPPREYERQVGSPKFWAELEAKGDFYRRLPVMPDAHILMEGVRHLNPTILTGCPRGNWAEAQKVAWAEEHFPGVPIITCRSSDKRLHAKPGDVLIDDWNQHRSRWIEHGGVWITHTDAETSLDALWAHYPSLKDGQSISPSTCGIPARDETQALEQRVRELEAVMDHPALREVLSFVQDSAPDEVMNTLRTWRAAQFAALDLLSTNQKER